MITFSQWWNGFKKTLDVKQVTWACGPEQILVDEIASQIKQRLNPDPWNFISLDAGSLSAREVWNEIDQLPLAEGFRLVQIRNAERLKNMDRLTAWVAQKAQNPKTVLLFLSTDSGIPRVPSDEMKYKRTGAPAPFIDALSGKGQVVECKPFTQSTAKHAVAWVQTKANITANLAGYLLDRADGNLRIVRDVCLKLSLFDQDITATTINALLDQKPRDSFVDALLALDKKTALLALRDVPEGDYMKTLGMLDAQLDFAGIVHDLQLEHKTNAEIAKAVGGRAYYLSQITPVAKHYDKKRRAEIRSMLALVDEALQLGQRAGTLEAVTALW